MIDIAEHIGLIWHVIATMAIPPHLRDEAFSEGLVIAAVAAGRFDEQFGVPPGAYLAQRLRWGLRTWRQHELRHHTDSLPDDLLHADSNARLDLDDLLRAAHALNDNEYVALIGEAWGLSRSEISWALYKNPRQLAAIRAIGRLKLEHELSML